MANKIITLVINTLDQSLDSVLAAAIDEVHKLGHSVTQIRVADDSGEVRVPVNTVPGVTVPEPVQQVSVPAEEPPAEETPPAPELAPAPAEETPAEPPVDTPVTPPTEDTTTSVA